jgi:CO dehydrogenase/acetyl-CoA synthase delta subunit
MLIPTIQVQTPSNQMNTGTWGRSDIKNMGWEIWDATQFELAGIDLFLNSHQNYPNN